METGEGKTFAATLPACTAALAGYQVHVVTVNDYLAERDATEMGPLYRFLGLSVGVVVQGMPKMEHEPHDGFGSDENADAGDLAQPELLRRRIEQRGVAIG